MIINIRNNQLEIIQVVTLKTICIILWLDSRIPSLYEYLYAVLSNNPSVKWIDAAAEIGRNPVSKHQIQPEYGDDQADAGIAKPVSRDQILRCERGQGNINFLCSAHHEQDWQPYPVDRFSYCLRWPYIHTYIHTNGSPQLLSLYTNRLHSTSDCLPKRTETIDCAAVISTAEQPQLGQSHDLPGQTGPMGTEGSVPIEILNKSSELFGILFHRIHLTSRCDLGERAFISPVVGIIRNDDSIVL